MEESWQEKKIIRFILFTLEMLEEIFKEYDNHPPFDIPKTKEEAMELSEELGELSEDEEKNIDRMKEIAKILTNFYLDNNKDGKDGMWTLQKDNN